MLEPTVDPASPRTLANGLRVPLDQPADAVPLLEWVASCLLLISERAGSVRKGDYLWELIHPQTDAGVPLLSHRGRYVVRLYDHGCWRAVTVDDTLPCGAAGGCVLPCTLAPLELWPLLLTKALLKLGARTAAGLQPRDPGVLTALTGWLPQAIPIAPASQPAHLIWLAITRALGAAGTIVAVAADVPEGDEARAAELAAIGVRPGPLVGVLEARSAAGDNYVRLTCAAPARPGLRPPPTRAPTPARRCLRSPHPTRPALLRRPLRAQLGARAMARPPARQGRGRLDCGSGARRRARLETAAATAQGRGGRDLCRLLDGRGLALRGVRRAARLARPGRA